MTLGLTVLGCAPTHPRPGQPCSGYLLRSDHTSLLIDCGPGTFAALQKYLSPHDLTAVWVSHLHPDHSADLLALFSWAVNTPGASRPIVFGPQGWANNLAAMLPSPLSGGTDTQQLVYSAFDVHDLDHNHDVDLGDLHLLSLAVAHTVPAFGLRADHDGTVLAYSGDTGPCPELNTLARDADLFVCEAATSHPLSGHCTPTDAATAARTAHARHLLLTHLPLPGDPTAQALDPTLDAGCPILTAHPGLHLACPVPHPPTPPSSTTHPATATQPERKASE